MTVAEVAQKGPCSDKSTNSIGAIAKNREAKRCHASLRRLAVHASSRGLQPRNGELDSLTALKKDASPKHLHQRRPQSPSKSGELANEHGTIGDRDRVFNRDPPFETTGTANGQAMPPPASRSA